MTHLEQDGIRVWFFDPVDTAVSKYARSQPIRPMRLCRNITTKT